MSQNKDYKLIILAVLHKQGEYNGIKYDNANLVVATQKNGEYVACDFGYKCKYDDFQEIFGCSVCDVSYKELVECYFDKFGRVCKAVLK